MGRRLVGLRRDGARQLHLVPRPLGSRAAEVALKIPRHLRLVEIAGGETGLQPGDRIGFRIVEVVEDAAEPQDGAELARRDPDPVAEPALPARIVAASSPAAIFPRMFFIVDLPVSGPASGAPERRTRRRVVDSLRKLPAPRRCT